MPPHLFSTSIFCTPFYFVSSTSCPFISLIFPLSPRYTFQNISVKLIFLLLIFSSVSPAFPNFPIHFLLSDLSSQIFTSSFFFFINISRQNWLPISQSDCHPLCLRADKSDFVLVHRPLCARSRPGLALTEHEFPSGPLSWA